MAPGSCADSSDAPSDRSPSSTTEGCSDGGRIAERLPQGRAQERGEGRQGFRRRQRGERLEDQTQGEFVSCRLCARWSVCSSRPVAPGQGVVSRRLPSHQRLVYTPLDGLASSFQSMLRLAITMRCHLRHAGAVSRNHLASRCGRVDRTTRCSCSW